MITFFRDFGAGVGLLGRGLRLVLADRALLARGALPVLLTSVLLFTGLGVLAANASDLVAWATPFADDWAQVWRIVLRVAVWVAVVVGAAAVSLLLFTALTLVVGGPFYESIAERVEDRELGGVPGAQEIGWGRAAWIGVRDAVLLVLRGLVWAIVLLVLGFVPVLGQTVVPVLAVCVGAWLVAVEVTGIPFVRRGIGLGERRRALRGRRGLTLGFGVPVYLLCLIPFAALLVFPAAMAGGTLLAHRVIGQVGTTAAGRR
ncbi:EI24 domain-containing protein [Actinokineospora sp. NBRC 105648]|uniref:EI24 domain-containing protein n=1 Tax=Actinokineospora sp. NBRC 105648 TaxID=3032206 RepID=UPI0024A2E98B|nr:EI24 domain-containing protein [Actinokineospora sp. NBRC 105648]GLZ42368.1 membrane protein [Actinokineospora sp. NBRC 105648]